MIRRRKFLLKLPSRTLELGERTLVMGVLNVTPDSFSDGGLYANSDRAIAHALAMQEAGADLIDIGGESTRPGSEGISGEEELRRVLPVLEGLRFKLRVPVSIDTQKAEVAEAAAAAGAEMVNDISGLRSDARIAEVARKRKLPLVLMHIRGTPRTMQKRPFARDVLRDVAAGLRAAIARATRVGVPRSQVILDPGIGFGKSFQQNYELLARLPELARLGCPLLVGTSRKAFLGATLAREGHRVPPEERIWGTAATVAASILGGAHIVRVHDVSEMVQIVRVADCILNPHLAPKA
ncbi:MAG TPA: dihydropteroate synthase [Candidatus Acidoferrales bacterium]|nr:dihydropteroate synthase [Candidatus Acidoferrales bacterium]